MISFRRVPWSNHARDVLTPAMPGMIQYHERLVREGAAQLWEVDGGASYCVIQIVPDCRDSAPEDSLSVFVLAYAGKDLIQATEAILDAAKAQGMNRVVFETRKPGIERLLRRRFNVQYDSTLFTIYSRDERKPQNGPE